MFYIRQTQDAQVWETRIARWQLRYGDQEPSGYQDVLALYTKLVEEMSSLGLVRLAELPFGPRGTPVTLREVAEVLAGQQLPGISPMDAIRLGKATLYSADDWYQACGD